MATFYVSPSGNNSNPGTNAAPLKTIRFAFFGNGTPVNANDEVICKPGTYNESFAPRDNITFTGLPGAIIDGTGLSGDLIQGSGIKNFTMQGFEVRNAEGACISVPKSSFCIFRNLKVHDCNRPGIIYREGDLVKIEDCEVYNCAKQVGVSGGSQGISIMRATPRTGATPAGWGGYRSIVQNCNCHHNIPTAGADTDGCGIIMDGANSNVVDYPGPTLIQDNICWENGGPGIRLMEAKNCDVFNNTCYHNMRDLRRTTTWGAGIHETLSRGNRIRYNVVDESGSSNNSTHAYQNTNAHDVFGQSAQTTFLQNVFFGYGGRHARAMTNLSGNGTEKIGATPSGSNNLIGVNPQLNNPGAGDFSLKAGSPAIGYGPGGDRPDAGAVQSITPPPPNPLIATNAPTITVGGGGAKSGQSFTFTEGDFSGGTGTLTKETRMQYVEGAGVTDLAIISGGTAIFPDVGTSAKTFRINTVGTKGSESVPNPSVSITLFPADVEGPEPPVEPTDLEEVKDRLVIVETTTTQHGTRLTTLEDRVGAVEAALSNSAGGGAESVAQEAKQIADQAASDAAATREEWLRVKETLPVIPEGYTTELSKWLVVVAKGEQVVESS